MSRLWDMYFHVASSRRSLRLTEQDRILMAQSNQSPDIILCDDGGRPRIDKYEKEQKFRPNDEVYITAPGTTAREGPFKVSAIKNGGYALVDVSGGLVRNGLAFKDNELELADPFA